MQILIVNKKKRIGNPLINGRNFIYFAAPGLSKIPPPYFILFIDQKNLTLNFSELS